MSEPTRIEQVLAALHIVIEDTRGRRGWARCPWHKDNTPTNFFVRLSGEYAGSSHCFSCKNGGSLADLVMHVRSCEFKEAKKFIQSLGKDYEPPKARVRVIRQPAKMGRMLFRLPTDIYFEPLKKWVSGARKYASGRCQITPEEVDLFGLGYAVDGQLASRIVLPWRGADGYVGGYSARTFAGEEPKYKTPHEDDFPDNGVMFGEHLWSTARELLVVTEGALNALAVRRALPEYRIDVGAMGGSEIFQAQAIKMSTFANTIVMTDSDPAGDKAAPALISMIGRYSDCYRVRLPDEKDALDVGKDFLRKKLVPLLEKLSVTRAPSAS
jgi:DNA primase